MMEDLALLSSAGRTDKDLNQLARLRLVISSMPRNRGKGLESSSEENLVFPVT